MTAVVLRSGPAPPQPFFASRVNANSGAGRGRGPTGSVPGIPLEVQRQLRRAQEQHRVQVAESRTRFHESYNPPASAARRARSQSRSPSRSPGRRRGGRGDACMEADGDAVAMMSQQQLLMELAESKAEVRQLREALRVFTAADGGNLPPELQAELEDHRRTVAELTGQIRDQDERLLEHDRRAGQSEDLIDKHRAALLRTVGNWSAGNAKLQFRWAWDTWRASAHAAAVERRQTEQVQAAIRGARASAKPALLRAVAELASAGDAPLARATLSAWHALLVAKKQQIELQQKRQERVQAVLLQWAGDFATTAPSVCFAGWRRHVEGKRQDAHSEKMRQEHAQVSAQMKRTAVLQVTMAMSLKMKEEGQVMIQQVFIHAWREAAVDSRATKALDSQRRRSMDVAAETKRLHEAQVLRNFAMFLAASRDALLANLFFAWRDFKVQAKQSRVVVELRLRQVAFAAWHRDTVLSRREHELHEERLLEERRRADVLDQQKQRRVLMAFSVLDKSGTRLLQQTLLAAWREATLEGKRQRSMELEWEKERQNHLEQQRARSAALAFSISGQLSEQNMLLELRAVWSAWNESVKASRRDKELEGAQRLFEEERNKVLQEAAAERRQLEDKATAEANRLEAEVAKFELDKAELDAKYHDVHTRRKFGFLMSLESRDQNMLIARVLACWKESTHYGAEAALREKLAKHGQLHATSMDALRQELAEAQQEIEMNRQERLSTSAASTIPSVGSVGSSPWMPQDRMADIPEDKQEVFVVRGAGGVGSSVDGQYRQVGTHIVNGTALYHKVGGEAILYFDSFWKMHTCSDTSTWCYSVYPSSGHRPPTGTWTTFGYNGVLGTADPAPTVTIDYVEPGSENSSSVVSIPKKSLWRSIAHRCFVCGCRSSGKSAKVGPASAIEPASTASSPCAAPSTSLDRPTSSDPNPDSTHPPLLRSQAIAFE